MKYQQVSHPSPSSIRALKDFLSLVEVKRFSKNLRNMILVYLINECEELPPNFDQFTEDLKFLFDFLDRVEK